MKALAIAVALVGLAGCDAPKPPPADTVDLRPARPSAGEVQRLAADRAALDDAHRRCKARDVTATPELCAAAAQATRRRFSGTGG